MGGSANNLWHRETRTEAKDTDIHALYKKFAKSLPKKQKQK